MSEIIALETDETAQKLLSLYIEYASRNIDAFVENARLIDEEESAITPSRINTNLALYTEINGTLISEFHRKQAELKAFKLTYQKWWDERYVALRAELQRDKPPSYKVAVSEVESELRVKYAEDYDAWQAKLIMAEEAVEFLRSLRDAWKTHAKMIENVAQNMRNNITAIAVEDRANAVPKIRAFDHQGERVATRVPLAPLG